MFIAVNRKNWAAWIGWFYLETFWKINAVLSNALQWTQSKPKRESKWWSLPFHFPQQNPSAKPERWYWTWIYKTQGVSGFFQSCLDFDLREHPLSNCAHYNCQTVHNTWSEIEVGPTEGLFSSLPYFPAFYSSRFGKGAWGKPSLQTKSPLCLTAAILVMIQASCTILGEL